MLDLEETKALIQQIEKKYPRAASILMENANQFDFETLEKILFR